MRMSNTAAMCYGLHQQAKQISEHHKLREARGLGKKNPLERRPWNSRQVNCPKLPVFRETKTSYLSADANDNSG